MTIKVKGYAAVVCGISTGIKTGWRMPRVRIEKGESKKIKIDS